MLSIQLNYIVNQLNDALNIYEPFTISLVVEDNYSRNNYTILGFTLSKEDEEGNLIRVDPETYSLKGLLDKYYNY